MSGGAARSVGMRRKARVGRGGLSAFQRLRLLPAEERAELARLRERMSGREIIAEARRRYGISGLSESALSRFWRWQAGEEALERINEDAEQFRAAFAREGVAATAEEIHARTLDYLRLRGVREDDERLLRWAVAEARKAIELENAGRRLALLERQAAAARAAVEDSKLTPEEKAARIREIFGGHGG